jgi:predicted transcriptional regulator
MAMGRRRGALEQEVLACLGAAGRPLIVAEVLAELGGDLAYTTVLTALSRLHGKGALIREPAGRGYAYALPADPGAAVTARRMSRLLDSREDRAGVLARFVADLRPEDEQLLTELLADERQDPEARP